MKNTLQGDIDDDGLGDDCDPDADGDDVANDDDNCPMVANEGQEDADGDGTGDACEDDLDGDGIANALDCQPLNPDAYPGGEERCDSVDNNCSGVVDEGYPDTDGDGLKDCVDLDDDNDGDPDDGDCAPLDPLVNSGAMEICDGKDNNCDGSVDEELGSLTCGKGACLHTVPACVDGISQPCDPMAGVELEECDSVDNDCDGLVDEDLGWSQCGLGACFHVVDNCVGGIPQNCDPAAGVELEECDGIDNDCNGAVDEGLGTTTCGLGTCAHSVQNCVGGQTQYCDPEQGLSPETCDGLDNDCNGEVDDGLGTITCGLGACEHAEEYCVGGKIQTCNPFAGAAFEQCDGLDNDCDGLADEDLGFNSCGLGECFHSVSACVDGQAPACDPLEGLSPEICDGKDNDCNGQVDEELGEVFCGLGECAHAEPACVGGVTVECDPFEGLSPEACDGLDNDCDDEVDEELGESTCGLGICEHSEANCIDGVPNECDPLLGELDEVCDGVDNNCDGSVDEGFEDNDGDQLADCVDPDDDNDNDLDETDCAPFDPDVNHDADEICFDGVDNDCDGGTDTGEACAGVSCSALHSDYPELASGAYSLDPDGDGGADPFLAWCEMIADGGGWTLVLKADGETVLWWGAGYWSDTALLNEDDLNVDAGNAKFEAFLKVKVTEMRGCLDDHCFKKSFGGTQTAREIFAAGAQVVGGHPGFGSGDKWSTQPNCKHYGVNTAQEYQHARFGYTANQENNCSSNDTAIGFGIGNTGYPEEYRHGAGYMCISSNCSKGNVNTGGDGFLWVR